MDSPWSGSLLDLLLNLVPCYWWSVCFLGVMLCFSPTRSAPELPGRGSQSSSGVFYRFTFKVQDGLRAPASPFLCAPSWGARRTRKVISSLRLGTQMEKVLHLCFSFSLCQEHWLLLPAFLRSGCSEQEVVLWVCQGRTPQCGPTLPRISSGRLPPSTWYLVAIQNYLLNGCNYLLNGFNYLLNGCLVSKGWFFKNVFFAWPMWLSGWVLTYELGVMVQFSVKAYTWVVDSISGGGQAGGSRSMILSQHWCFYLALPLSSSIKTIKKCVLQVVDFYVYWFTEENDGFCSYFYLWGCSIPQASKVLWNFIILIQHEQKHLLDWYAKYFLGICCRVAWAGGEAKAGKTRRLITRN